MSKVVPWAIGLLLLLGVGLWARSWLKDRDQDARTKADIIHAKQLAQTNTWWMVETAKERAQAKADIAAATKAETQGNQIRDRRAAEPPPPRRGEVSDSARADFWEGRAEGYRQEVGHIRTALEYQKQATARLLVLFDTTTNRLAATNAALKKALKREEDRGKFHLGLGIRIPKPPKWVAATVGCLAAGGAAAVLSSPEDRGSNAAKACGAGGTVATVLTPTD
jgi:hypothetical protein